MASITAPIKHSSLPVRNLLFISRHPIFAMTVFVTVLLVVCWVTVSVIQTQIAIHQQQQRFDAVGSVLTTFKTNTQKALGPNLTEIQEVDSCYHLAQSEAPVPFITNGVLYCGKELKGTANPLAGMSSSGNQARDTGLALSKIAMQALQQSGLQYTKLDANTGRAVPTGNFSFTDKYNIYSSDGTIGCDLTVSSDSGQDLFTFNCFQPAAKNFYHFVPTGLD